MLDYRLTIFDECGADVVQLQFSAAHLQALIGRGILVPVNGDTYRFGFVDHKLERYQPYQFEPTNSKATQC